MCLLRRLQALQESHVVRGRREVGRGAEAMSTRQALRCSQLFRIRNKPPAEPHSWSPSLRSTQWSPAVSEGATLYQSQEEPEEPANNAPGDLWGVQSPSYLTGIGISLISPDFFAPLLFEFHIYVVLMLCGLQWNASKPACFVYLGVSRE